MKLGTVSNLLTRTCRNCKQIYPLNASTAGYGVDICSEECSKQLDNLRKEHVLNKQKFNEDHWKRIRGKRRK